VQRIYEAKQAAQELEELFVKSAEDGGDVTHLEEQINTLVQKADSIGTAIDDLLTLTREIEVRAEARRAEAKRLIDRAKRDESVAEWFKGHVLRIMQEQGKKVFETPRWRATVAMPGGKQSMEIVAEVPPDFTIRQVTVLPDRQLIRESLEGGETLDFAYLVPKQPYLKVS
jgi:hypothetical protein